MFGWFAVCLVLVNSVVLIVILDMLCLCLGLWVVCSCQRVLFGIVFCLVLLLL